MNLNMDEMDYSLYDVNGDAYTIRIKRKDAIKYDQDHLLTYRTLTKLKRQGVRPSKQDNGETSSFFCPPYNSTMVGVVQGGNLENHFGSSEEDDLRSPIKKRVCPDFDLDRSFDQLDLAASIAESLEDSTEASKLKAIPEEEELAVPLIAEHQPEEVEVCSAGETPVEYVSSWMDVKAGHTFINEMGARIETFQKKKVPRTVYKEIADSMKLKKYLFTPDELYNKKRGLDATYCRYKKAVGKVKKWPYFDGMKYLHDGVWPAGFLSGSSDTDEANITLNSDTSECDKSLPTLNSDTSECDKALPDDNNNAAEVLNHHAHDDLLIGDNEPSDFEWNLSSEELLLEEVFEAQQQFEDVPLLKNSRLFQHVADRLQAIGLNVTRDKCISKYQALKIRFNSEYDKAGSTGQGATKWKHYELMLKLEKNSLSTKPIVTVSVGAVNKVQKVNNMVEKLRQGKSRPPSDTRQQRVSKLAGDCGESGSKNTGVKRALDMQLRRLQVDESLLVEFQTFNKESRERVAEFREGIKLLRELKNDLKKGE